MLVQWVRLSLNSRDMSGMLLVQSRHLLHSRRSTVNGLRLWSASCEVHDTRLLHAVALWLCSMGSCALQRSLHVLDWRDLSIDECRSSFISTMTIFSESSLAMICRQ